MSDEMLAEIAWQDQHRNNMLLDDVSGERNNKDDEAEETNSVADSEMSDTNQDDTATGELLCDMENTLHEIETGEENTNKNNKSTAQRPVIPVVREDNPLIEWTENDRLFGGAFPHLFLLGKGLPEGEMKLGFIKHCFKYYDGQFEDPLFIATAFNQKQ
jgi:hypothetical protein